MDQAIPTATSIAVVLLPLCGALLAGLFGKKIGHQGAHWITNSFMAVALACSVYLFIRIVVQNTPAYNLTFYSWVNSGALQLDIGVLIDRLSVTMMVVVTSVSLLVHIFSIGYMEQDPGYPRFFAYMSLFTFFMLTLVASNSFVLLFFGWEGVGLVSYLLIGFWFQRESAAVGSIKAFVVNRIGDLGFLLGIAAILTYFGCLDYAGVFAKAPELANTLITVIPGYEGSLMTLICILLFIGAMGKSAQIPLHVWLPESMEGPTPISALIHAATMVTAGVYMIARLSPLFELSAPALSTVLIFGATGALFLGILGVVQNDIKRVIAYSTMSQLGYMMAANGASAFAGALFHLVTHAYFKALLFLAAGSVIIAMHHQQDMRKMGGLRRSLPITYATFVMGSLALCAIPPFAGFYSKDAIIEAVQQSTLFGAQYAYWCLLIGAFVTALYTFRALFLTFHGEQRGGDHGYTVHEPRYVVLVPLILLAIPSCILGAMLVKPMLYATPSLLGSTIYVASERNVLAQLAPHFAGVGGSISAALAHLPLWFSLAGILCAWLCYLRFPALPQKIVQGFPVLYRVLVGKYGFDRFNEKVWQRGTLRLSHFFYRVTDTQILDLTLVDGSGRLVNRLARWLRCLQSGYLYHYAFAMIIGLLGFLIWYRVTL